MSKIQITDLTFAYDGTYDNIFDHVSFQIDTNWKLGFTGRNGRGKTTLLRLLLGQYEYAGHISAPMAFEYFPFPIRDESLLTMEILEGICPDLPYWKIQRELSLLEVDEEILYRPFDTLSKGEQTKALLAVLFLKENHFLLIDEPTNHLDQQGRALVSRYLKSKKGFILVSHDRAFLDGCVDHILSINRSDIEVQRGNFSTWWENKQRRDAFELAENEKLKKEIQRLEETAKEKAQWSDAAERRKLGIDPNKVDNKKGWRSLQAAKAKKTMARSKAIEARQQSAMEEKSKLLKNIEHAEALKLRQLPYHSSRFAELKDVAVAYEGRTVCQHVSFAVERGDRIALCGRNGSGKSSILKLLCGQKIPYTGTLERGSRLKISYVAQDTAHLRGSLTDYARAAGIDESLFKAILRKLDFARVQFEKDMATFSGGQKKKVLIARSLCEEAHLHLWDEPMNFIDVISRMQIESLLLEFQPTIVFVEHDSAFCQHIATKRVEL